MNTKKYHDYVSNYFTTDITIIESNTIRLRNTLATLMKTEKLDELKQLLDETDSMRYSGEAYLQRFENRAIDRKIFKHIVYNEALLDLAKKYYNISYNDQEITRIITPERYKLLKYLYENVCTTNHIILEQFGISQNELNSIIEVINSTDITLIVVQELQNVMIYGLTPAAYQYLKHKETKESMEE